MAGGIILVLLAKCGVFFMEAITGKALSGVPEQVLEDLKRLNVPVYLSGYRQLCVAIPIFAADVSQPMCGELYPAVAQELGYVDWRAVEFAIRRTILAAWENRDMDAWNEYFPGIAKAPSNKRFIATLAQRIK